MEPICLKDITNTEHEYTPEDILWFFEEVRPGEVCIVDRNRNAAVYRLSAEEISQLKTRLKASGAPIWFGAFQGESLGLQNIPNARGLGGLETGASSVIGHHRLIRSEMLHDATREDIEFLTQTMGLKTIIDLRTDLEIAAKPDPKIPGVRWIHVPFLTTREYEGIGLRMMTEDGLLEMGKKGPDMMKEMYRRIVGWPEGIEGLKTFFRLLLEQESGSVLWHCTQGKDRTGVAAAILERILGCDRNTVEHDYLQTNVYLATQKDQTDAWLEKKLGMKPKTVQDFSFLFEAEPQFLQAAWDVIDEEFGGFETYLQRQLDLSPEKIARLREMYTL